MIEENCISINCSEWGKVVGASILGIKISTIYPARPEQVINSDHFIVIGIHCTTSIHYTLYYIYGGISSEGNYGRV